MNLTTARSRLIPSLEKQEMPACLPLVQGTLRDAWRSDRPDLLACQSMASRRMDGMPSR